MARATLSTHSEAQVLSNQVDTLLSAYESFLIQQDVPGISGYAMTLKTDIYVHRVRTKRDTYLPTSFYVGTSLTALPSMGFMRQWLKNSREVTLKTINKGKYRYETLINGEWQMVDGKYNRWFFYDRKNNALIGQVQVNDLATTDHKPSKTSSNPQSKASLKRELT